MNNEFNSDWIVTVLLWFFLGMLWVHRFYNWKIWTGILMIFTLWGLWIWWLIDGIIIVLWKFEKKDGSILTVKIENKIL